MNYVEKRSVVNDLINGGILHCDVNKKLITEWDSDAPVPGLIKMLTAKEKKRDQGDAFVRWRVQLPGDLVSAVWEDKQVRNSWVAFEASRNLERGFCMVSGETTALAESHPKRLRHAADGAKLISSNDSAGYTYRGRFDSPGQACGVGSSVTQKAHSALRWLIDRQGYKSGDQAFVAWAVNGKAIPDPLADTSALFGAAELNESPAYSQAYQGDAGQHFALQLNKAIGGYKASFGEDDEVVVLALDSATPGRMAITFYRELSGIEFLDRVKAWHESCAWPQVYSKSNHYVGAPAPRDIAEAAYGRRLDDRLRKSVVERLLPCIVDSRPIPQDLVISTVRRACNRAGLELWEWEKCLGIACALFRGGRSKEEYRMSLEETRNTRDYLFGRLLAIAENIEQRALHLANEPRDTNAARLMQRFADHPCSTWRSLELALTPYKARLRSSRPSVLLERDKLLDLVTGMFTGDDFVSDGKLGGEFLLGYHCQRAALWAKAKSSGSVQSETVLQTEGDKE